MMHLAGEINFKELQPLWGKWALGEELFGFGSLADIIGLM